MYDPKRRLEFIYQPPLRQRTAGRQLYISSHPRRHMAVLDDLTSFRFGAFQCRFFARLRKQIFSALPLPRPSPPKERRQQPPKACGLALSAQAMRWMD